jgi:hypothetical protein
MIDTDARRKRNLQLRIMKTDLVNDEVCREARIDDQFLVGKEWGSDMKNSVRISCKKKKKDMQS